MTGNGAPPDQPVRRITLLFPVGDRPECLIQPENVTPAELYLGAWLLDAYAREIRAGTVAAGPVIAVARQVPRGLRGS